MPIEGGLPDLRRAATPLRMIFWGGLICIFDFTLGFKVDGEGFKVDVLNDFLGMALITIGIFRLAALDATPSFRRGMVFVEVVSVIATVKAAIDHAVFEAPAVWDVAWTLFSLATLAAIVLFCFTMRFLCRRRGLEGPAASWKTTSVLFILVYLLPLGGFHIASLIGLLTGRSFNLNLGPAGLALLLVFVIPLIHLFVSTSRMRRAAGESLP